MFLKSNFNDSPPPQSLSFIVYVLRAVFYSLLLFPLTHPLLLFTFTNFLSLGLFPWHFVFSPYGFGSFVRLFVHFFFTVNFLSTFSKIKTISKSETHNTTKTNISLLSLFCVIFFSSQVLQYWCLKPYYLY